MAGQKATKPNSWKDFNACEEYLIKNHYISADKFGITGLSAGGILIGRALNDRPDLSKVVIPEVGLRNSLRYEFTPNGAPNIPEFGTITIKEEFKHCLKWMLINTFKRALLIRRNLSQLASTIPGAESYIPGKFAAKMQSDNSSQNPAFLYVNYVAGHFGSSTQKDRFVQSAQEYSFLLWQCGDDEFQLKSKREK